MKVFGVIDKVLVIAPLSVARQTWPDEIHKWDHLKDLSYSLILGNEESRLAALDKQADIYIVNRENVVWLVEHYKKQWPFKNVIIDELSSFKSSKSKRFRALRKVRPLMDRVIGLTGTPAPNTLIDLWPQIYLLDLGERLGKTITGYRNRYFYPGAASEHVVYEWKLKQGAEQDIYDAIGDICVSMKSRDYLKLPERTDNIVPIELSSKELKAYDQMERDYVLDMDGDQIMASNAAVLANKLIQLANGAVYDDEGNVQVIHNKKLGALADVIEAANGQPVLVFYNYQHDLDRILKKFPEAKKLDVKAGDVKRWNDGEIPILLAHPQSAGHGLNLQQGGHIIVWFSMIWSLEFYQQANARLDRQGQTQPVIIHHLVAKNTIDERIMTVLRGKAKNQDGLLAAVKARIDEVKRNEV